MAVWEATVADEWAAPVALFLSELVTGSAAPKAADTTTLLRM
jgi:hypothetical protein